MILTPQTELGARQDDLPQASVLANFFLTSTPPTCQWPSSKSMHTPTSDGDW